jgi:hypothetical protein
MSIPARILDRLIHWYQVLGEGRISPCRYVPSCSTYARESLAAHGALRGSYLAARRLGRCHPWGGHGFDPVPGTDARTGAPTGHSTGHSTGRHSPSPARRTS